MFGTRHWNNAYATMRTANGLGFDKIYLVDLHVNGGKPPKMNYRKIFMDRPPHNMFELISHKKFMKEILPLYNGVSMELTEKAGNLIEYQWKENPLIIVGPENSNIPDDVLELTEQVKVPMAGLVNCMNVSCAASIAMYDYILKEKFKYSF